MNSFVNYFHLKRNTLFFPYRDYLKRNNCIFIHIPRSAGTSILNNLGKNKAGRDHLPWYVYYTANPKFYSKAFKFSFVRNPWSRTLSAYNYLTQGGNKQSDIRVAEMIKLYDNIDDFVVNGLGRGTFRNHLLFIPQSEFVINGEGELAVDFLGKYETITKDYSTISERLGLKKHLPVINQSTIGTKDYRLAYKSDEAISIVENLYRQDVLVFDYQY